MRLWLSLIAAGLFVGAFVPAAPARADGGPTATPVPTVRKMSDPTAWLQRPPDGPTQLEHGAFVYWLRCMVCHGDQGQGLAKFRFSYPKQDQNCSSQKCHGGPDSGAGFSFPDAPAIMGPGTLTRFQTAQDLFNFISTQMPYQSPGILPAGDYWALVTFLLHKHAIDVPQLDAQNAASVHLYPSPSLLDVVPYLGLGAGFVIVLSGSLLLWKRRH
jgi:cytochrome c